MVASITELNLKNLWAFFQFLPHAVKSKNQAGKAPGALMVKVGMDGILTQRTLTVWESEKAMMDYVRSGAHLNAMRVFSKIANKSYTARFPVEKFPSWEEAIKYLRENGREF